MAVEISTLQGLQQMFLDLTGDYILTADIDATDTAYDDYVDDSLDPNFGTRDVTYSGSGGFLPIGDGVSNFTGTFDGDGYTISGLYINRATSYHGLFGYVGGAGTVQNVTLTDVDISGGVNYAGALCGFTSVTAAISSCSASGIVSNTNSAAGGLIGQMSGDSTATDCNSSVNVSGLGGVGGFVGRTDSGAPTCLRCFASGTVVGASATVPIGGFCGQGNALQATSCYASGAVTGGRYCGGFVGTLGVYDAEYGQISDCYCTGKVIGVSTSGRVGGFCGYQFRSAITKCYSTGVVEYSNTTNPTNCGFVGGVDATLGYSDTLNFFDSDTSLQSTTTGNATAKTTILMMDIDTFSTAGWSIADISTYAGETWIIEDGVTYPLMGWMFPCKATTPDPADEEVGTDFSDYTLSWVDSDVDASNTFDVYIGESEALLTLISSTQEATSLVIPEADRLAKTVETWYWRVDSTNEAETTTGDVWTFDPYWSPTIVSQSTGGEKPLGSGVTLTVVATGMPIPTYQWYVDGSVIAGATSASYTLYVSGDHVYKCRVTNAAGYVDSDDITITEVPNEYSSNLFDILSDLVREDG